MSHADLSKYHKRPGRYDALVGGEMPDEEGERQKLERQPVQVPCNCVHGACFQPGTPGCIAKETNDLHKEK